MTKEERRQRMPNCTQWIDETRAEFGEPAGIWAAEGGEVVSWPEVKPQFIEVSATPNWRVK
jgi:hypothetical protein